MLGFVVSYEVINIMNDEIRFMKVLVVVVKRVKDLVEMVVYS